jgi:hypothetical protein
VSYLFFFFITGLHSGGGLSAHVTDVTITIKEHCKTSMNDEYTHSTQSSLECPKYIKKYVQNKKKKKNGRTETKR